VRASGSGKPARRGEENVVAEMSVTMEIHTLTNNDQRLNPE
jgi:hypothetical protein